MSDAARGNPTMELVGMVLDGYGKVICSSEKMTIGMKE